MGKRLFENTRPAPTRPVDVVDHFMGPLPEVPPTTGIRRWGKAFTVAGLLTALSLLVLATLGGPWTRAQLVDGIHALGHLCLPHVVRSAPAWHVGMALPMLALLPAVLVFPSLLKPRFGVRHIDGQRVIGGREAVRAFQLEAKRMGVSQSSALLSLHPAAFWPASQWKKHVLITGGVGSGKTQILLHIVRQIFAGKHRAFIYDVKGDFTAVFPTAAILSPFDERSFVWHIAADCQTSVQAAALAQAFIPAEEGQGKFWSVAAQMLLEGCVLSLQADKPGTWGWGDLRDRLSLAQGDFAALMARHHRKAENLIADPDSSATSSVLGTLSAYTADIDKLAAAWPHPVKKRSIALTRWVADDWTGPRQLIVQAGVDADLSAVYISAMMAVCAGEILSPRLPDNESGRHLFFVLDELTSIRRIDVLPSLIDKGRSKGVSIIAGLQDQAQLIERYGPNIASALSAMVGTQILCRVMPGQTRETLIQNAGKKRVAVTSVTTSGGFKDGVAGSSSVSVQEEPVLSGEDLSTLGPVFERGKFQGVKAMVTTGRDYLELLWPPQILPSRRPGQVPAFWTLPDSEKGVLVIPPRVQIPAREAPTELAGDVAHRLGGEALADALQRLKRGERDP